MGGGRQHKVKQEIEIVQCAVCNSSLASSKFATHNVDVHNMLAWIEGETPLDLSNEKLVLSLLNKTLKGKKRKVLLCEVCGEEKKSAVGFYTHKQICGKTEEERDQLRIQCEVCGKSVMPTSVKSHMMIHQRKSITSEDFDNPMESPGSASMPCSSRGDYNGRRNKRAAATRAKSRMIAFLSDDGFPQSVSPDTSSGLYSELISSGWEVTPRLLQTWRGFLSLTGTVLCVYNGCSFRAQNIDLLQNHLTNCEFSQTHELRYLCNVCLSQCRDESEMVLHIQAEHESKESIASANSFSGRDSGSDQEVESPHVPSKRQNRQSVRPKLSGPPRPFNKMRFLQNTVTAIGKDLEIYRTALDWTFDFRLSNYTDSVFPILIPHKRDWVLIHKDIETYIPATSNSVPVEFKSAIQDVPVPPHQFSLFEGQIIDGVSTFFTGGPVWAMDWCPIPMKVCLSEDSAPSEYLAVSTHHNMDDTFCVPQCYQFRNVIQFWKCGNLSSRNLYQRPKLALALAHECGTIWSLAWCPSGAFDIDKKLSCNDDLSWSRMGLLAAACSNGNVEIFSVPFPDQLTDHVDKECLPVYAAQPTLTLVTNFTEPSQCTRVAWYQGRRHGLVAAGYCNGMVAFWDLVTLPPLLYDANKRFLKPFQCFQAHLTVVSALSFNPEYDGRFFMTGSHDRGVKFWDMEDLSAPMTHHRRGYVTDGVWLNLWISSITSYDDAFQHEHTNSTLHPVRDYGYKPYPLLTQNSVAWCLSFNDWINATAQGSEAGEIVVTFSSQLMRGLENEKNAIDKRIMASYTLLKKLIQQEDGKKKLGEVVLWKPEPKQPSKKKGKKATKGSKGKGKGKGATQLQDEDEQDDVAASLYTPEAVLVERSPQFYSDVQKGYGICVYDTVKMDSNKNKLPEEAKSRVRISGKMHPTCSDFYPITSINKISWNPNIGRFFWLASGHQCGIVRITGMHFMENAATQKFLQKAAETVNHS